MVLQAIRGTNKHGSDIFLKVGCVCLKLRRTQGSRLDRRTTQVVFPSRASDRVELLRLKDIWEAAFILTKAEGYGLQTEQRGPPNENQGERCMEIGETERRQSPKTGKPGITGIARIKKRTGNHQFIHTKAPVSEVDEEWTDTDTEIPTETAQSRAEKTVSHPRGD